MMEFQPTGLLIISLGILLLLSSLFTLLTEYKKVSKVNKLDKMINSSIEGLADGKVGICVLDAEGNLIYALNPDLKLIPASNLKLFTGAAALLLLGPNYAYETKVYYAGTIKNGTLHGNLIVKGSGDPSLTYEDISKIAITVSKMVKAIEGNIIVDENIFDQKYVESSWDIEDLQYYYAARVSGLSVEKNVIRLVVYPGEKEREPARIELIPNTSYVKIINMVRTVSGSDSNIQARKALMENRIVLNGEIGVYSESMEFIRAIEDPPLYFGTLLRELLALNGVVVKGQVKKGILPANAIEIMKIKSKPLSELLRDMMKSSDNMMAEHLLKTLGAVQYGKGSFETGIKAVISFLKEIGINSSLTMVDGSGLSHLNQVSPRTIAQLLQKMKEQKYFEYFINSLPIAGVDGTLKKRMIGTPAEGKVFAKTGTLSGVSTLSGYIKTEKGEAVFSIMINSSTQAKERKRIIDEICVKILDYFMDQ